MPRLHGSTRAGRIRIEKPAGDRIRWGPPDQDSSVPCKIPECLLGHPDLEQLNWRYVDRPTEIEAYRFAVAEAGRLGVADPSLRKYLKVPWISRKEHERLLSNVGVSLR